MKPCANHDEYVSGCFSCYLSQPCDECDRTADHSGTSKATRRLGRFCNDHIDWNKYARALND